MNKKNINISIGKQLRLRRTIMGMSQSGVAKLLGITFQQIQKYESGANNLSAERLMQFAQMFEVPIVSFFEEIESFRPANKKTLLESNYGYATPRESLELIKAFNQISSEAVRKKLAHLIHNLADTEAD